MLFHDFPIKVNAKKWNQKLSERSKPSSKMQVVQAEPAPYVNPDAVHTHISASMFKCLQKLIHQVREKSRQYFRRYRSCRRWKLKSTFLQIFWILADHCQIIQSKLSTSVQLSKLKSLQLHKTNKTTTLKFRRGIFKTCSSQKICFMEIHAKFLSTCTKMYTKV